MVPTQHTNQQTSGHYHFITNGERCTVAGSDNQGGTTGAKIEALVPSSIMSVCLGDTSEGRDEGFFLPFPKFWFIEGAIEHADSHHRDHQRQDAQLEE